jgi:hypothetical protein
MSFVVTVKQSPKLALGSRGEELSCYIPADVRWQQLNYGQWEGQVEIDGCEWGFYWTDSKTFEVILHAGGVKLNDAIQFVRKVAKKVGGNSENYRLLLKGQKG